MTVTVIATSAVNFTAEPDQHGAPGTNVTFTNASTAGGTAFAWTFGAGTGHEHRCRTRSHIYNTAGTYTVSLTVTYPAPTGVLTTTKTGYITVAVGNCLVPTLQRGQVQQRSRRLSRSPYNFTGAVIRGTGAPNGNFTITAQSLTAGSMTPCNSDITVNHP